MNPNELRRLANFIRKCADTCRPITPYVDCSGFERALEQIRKMR